MSIHFKREKKNTFLLRFIYNLNKILFLSQKRKLRLFLDLEWIFGRLAHEASFNHYDIPGHPFRIKGKNFLINGISEENTVLDLGCNHGVNAWFISKKAKEVVGIDFDAKAIELAKKQFQAPNLTFVAMEASAYLSETPKKFDTLILSHILEHIDDQRGFLMSFKKQFSRIYIELPDLQASFLNEYRMDTNANFQYTDDDHVVEFDRKDLLNLFHECGLKVTSSEFIYGLQKYWCEVTG